MIDMLGGRERIGVGRGGVAAAGDGESREGAAN